jgi:hypothetical protein
MRWFKMRRMKHLYRYGAKKYMIREFEKRYGKRKGKEIYGAVVGKIKRLREAKRRRRR